jgi:hypothetical protein
MSHDVVGIINIFGPNLLTVRLMTTEMPPATNLFPTSPMEMIGNVSAS